MKIEGQFHGEIDQKRFYMPGTKFIDTCRVCQRQAIWDGKQEYLSYPDVGKPIDFDWYCPDCGNEWNTKILIQISISEVK